MIEPPQDDPGPDVISRQAYNAFLRRHNAMMFNYFKMNLFKAALTSDLRSMVAQQDQTSIMIKKMYRVPTTAQREGKGKAPANEVPDEDIGAEVEDDDNDVAAFN